MKYLSKLIAASCIVFAVTACSPGQVASTCAGIARDAVLDPEGTKRKCEALKEKIDSNKDKIKKACESNGQEPHFTNFTQSENNLVCTTCGEASAICASLGVELDDAGEISGACCSVISNS